MAGFRVVREHTGTVSGAVLACRQKKADVGDQRRGVCQPAEGMERAGMIGIPWGPPGGAANVTPSRADQDTGRAFTAVP